MTSRALANTYNDIISPFEIFGEYFLVPFIKGSSEVGDMLWDIAIGKENKDYLHQQERKFWSKTHEHYVKIERDFTPEQKEALSFALKAAEVAGIGKLYSDFATTSLRHVIKPNSVVHNIDNDFHSKYSFTDDLNKIDFETTPRFDLGKISSASRHQVLNKLPNYVPEGRIDYSRKFSVDIENYDPGTEKLFHGKVAEDLYLINYHDKNKIVGLGKGERTLAWATHLEVGNRMPTIAEIHQHLALVEPDWGVRNSYSIIKIPAGEQVTFISGKAKAQPSLITGDEFKGGGYQVRFRDFDEKWTIETKDLNK